MKIEWVLCAVAVTAVLGIFLYQKHQISVLTESITILTNNNAKLEAAVHTQSETVDFLQVEMRVALESNARLAERFSEYAKTAQENKLKLDYFRGRLARAALEKPDHTERLVYDAVAGILHQFTEATGGTSETSASTASDTPQTTPSSGPRY